MKAIMKTMKRNIVIIAMAVAFALPAMAQFGTNSAYDASPNMSFQSTSTMVGSGSSFSSTPMLNSDGTAAYSEASYSPAKAPGGPHRAPEPISTDDEVDEYGEGFNTPIADAFWPLALMALAYSLWRIARKRMLASGR